MKNKAAQCAISWVGVIVAGLIQATALYMFVLPNSFSPGGVAGIAAIIQYIWNINSGYFIFALNIPLLILAFFFFKKDYVFKTLVSIALTSVALLVMEKLNFPVFKTEQTLLAAIAGGVVGGFALGLLFKVGGSNGGSEIVGGILQQKFPAYNIAWFIFAIDSVVVLITAIVVKAAISPLEIIILSLTKMFISSKVCSTFMEGFKAAIKFEVVTPHPDELGHEIISELKRGVTVVPGKGLYSGKEKSVLLCVVRKRQIGAFQKILKKYPDTFAYIMNTKEVYGYGFSAPIKKSDENQTEKSNENQTEKSE